MGDVRNTIDAGWKQRCHEKLEKLKAKQFSTEDSHHLEELSGKKKFMNFEMYEAVRTGGPDDLVIVMENIKLPLPDIMDQITHGGDSLLHVAARHGNEKIAELVASHSPSLLTKRNVVGNTALHVAARFRRSKVIEVILSQSDAVQNKDEEMITRLSNRVGNTALHEAVARDYLDGVAQLFHKDKAVAHYLNHADRSPLYMAVYSSKSMDIIRCLLADLLKENPPPQPWHNGQSPLHAAVKSKSASLLQTLVKMLPELIYLRDEFKGTALHYAAFSGYLKGVHILLESFPQAALEWNSDGNLPVHLACRSGKIDVVKELLKQTWPKPGGLLTETGQNILHVAAKFGNHDLVKYILMKSRDLGIDLNERDADGNTPLHLASQYMYPKVIFYLTRDKRIQLHNRNMDGLTARDVVILESDTPKTYRERLSHAILSYANAYCTKKGLERLHPYQDIDQIKNLINTLMLVAILIATVTFAAGFTVPGSVYGSDIPDPQLRGAAILVKKAVFQIFMICNTIAMCSSTVASFILLWSQLGDYHLARSSFEVALHMVVVALVTMSGAFMAAANLVVRSVSWLAQVITIIGIISILFILSAYILFKFPLESPHPWLRQFSNIFFRILIPFAGSYEKVNTKEKERKITDSPKENKDNGKKEEKREEYGIPRGVPPNLYS